MSSSCYRRLPAAAGPSKSLAAPSTSSWRHATEPPPWLRPRHTDRWPRIALRSPSRSRSDSWLAAAVARREGEGSCGAGDGDGDDGRIGKERPRAAGPCRYAVGRARGRERRRGSGGGEPVEVGVDRRKAEVAAAAAATVVLGVGNRVLYKLALVPLKHYPFFLAQLATVGYVVVYFSILYLRYHAGIVTDEMLSMPKAPFVAVGMLEALAAATGMAAGAILSGASIPVLSQTFLVWQILLSTIFLGRRYKANQIFGCFLVAVGVIITVASGSSPGHSLKEAGIFWSLLMIASFLFQAADTVLKEIIFLDAAKDLKGGSVDLFVVNSYGSAFQHRPCSYSSSSLSCQNYGVFLLVSCQIILEMAQPVF
ncbi:protein CLT1, chloroplastic isoform X2 [Eucalyptus grandis]|uniref:protein CLT1, chloroplastic isoform X2 n=1 Tax=Eucalyptus grandis TaxID=71139 RepID=UPI00192E7BE3|nr:protein CLT1, chloroplastic isoform X2 [Eucalyptus grandis]